MHSKVCIAFAKGCPRSQIDCVQLIDYFSSNNWEVVDSITEADLVLLHTCAFAERPEKESLKFLKLVQKKLNKNGQIIVFGCFPGVNKDLLKSHFNGTTLTSGNLDKLDTIIDAKVPLKEIPDPHVIKEPIEQAKKVFSVAERFQVHFNWGTSKDLVKRSLSYLGYIGKPLRDSYGDIYCLRIAKGCMNECSYCAIRLAIGPLKSKRIDEILSEFRQGLDQGAKTFELLAGDVGAFGQDINTNIVELLKEIFAVKDDFKLLLSEFNPRWFVKYRDDLIKLFITNRDRIGFIMLPMQSASDHILESMKREHDSDSVLQAILKLKDEAPELKLSTHVLVGFPGESDNDFMDTLRFLESAGFDEVYLYPYSDRPNTKSIDLPNKIPQAIIDKRMNILKKEFKSIAQV